MTWKLDTRYIGYPNIEPFLPTLAIAITAPGGSYVSGAYPPVPQNLVVTADDPVWGAGEFILAKANATIPLRAMCSFLPVWNVTNRNYDWNATPVANTALLGRMVGVCMSEQGSVGAVNALTTGQFGWFMVSGVTPVNGTATVAADTAFGITAAGQVGAVTAGKQIVNARIVTAATQAVAVASVSGASGSNTIRVANSDGFFVGGYLSGTGVGAAAICQTISSDGKTITASVVNSAAVTGNVTCTYNNATIFYNVAKLNRAFAQGQIT